MHALFRTVANESRNIILVKDWNGRFVYVEPGVGGPLWDDA
jgi:hypothetical protein